MPNSQTTSQTELDFAHPVEPNPTPESRGGQLEPGVGRAGRSDLELWLLAYSGPEPGSLYGENFPDYYNGKDGLRGLPF
jgi:hypothetical protein